MSENQETKQTQNYLQNYIRSNIEDGIWGFALRIATTALEFLLIIVIGYEVEKIISDEKKEIWAFVEFFGVSTFCLWIWIKKESQIAQNEVISGDVQDSDNANKTTKATGKIFETTKLVRKDNVPEELFRNFIVL